MEDNMIGMLKAFYNKNVLEFIIDDLNTQLMKIGYHGDLHVKNPNDSEMKWEVESDSINMTPSIFKDLYIHGNIWLKEYDLNKDYIEYTILLDWCWKTFDGGENGILLGTTKYIAHKDLFPEIDEDFIPKYEFLSKVRKIHGIEL